MISKDEVIRIAKLARLELTAQEVEKMQKDLSSILDYFDLLKKAPNPKGQKEIVSDMLANSTREDKVAEKSASVANNLIQTAPNTKDGYIKVKQVL